ncbi:hypothetical protein DI291_11505 [Bacillus paralicheniformis]|nr:hypothetical protein DI291_11505 [Bacillus paralicheniformis]
MIGFNLSSSNFSTFFQFVFDSARRELTEILRPPFSTGVWCFASKKKFFSKLKSPFASLAEEKRLLFFSLVQRSRPLNPGYVTFFDNAFQAYATRTQASFLTLKSAGAA